MHSNYLKTDGFDGPNGTGDDFVAGGRVSTTSPSNPLPHPPPLALACLPNMPLLNFWSSYNVCGQLSARARLASASLIITDPWPDTPTKQGMFGDYAVHALWTDTTTMNTDKPIPYTCHGSLSNYTLNCTHVPTAYGNNDSDNNEYWNFQGVHQNYQPTDVVWKGSFGGGPSRKGDNGWQV
jgi:hypothetical protein